MAKFRKKPVVINALCWDGQNTHEVIDFIGVTRPTTLSQDQKALEIETLEGIMRADVGDWIIRGVKGECYPCKPDIFEQTYEKA